MFAELLRSKLAGICELSEPQIERLKLHYELLTRWNTVLNLTSVRTLEEVVERHYCESVFAACYLTEAPASVADIGSGAGSQHRRRDAERQPLPDLVHRPPSLQTSEPLPPPALPPWHARPARHIPPGCAAAQLPPRVVGHRTGPWIRRLRPDNQPAGKWRAKRSLARSGPAPDVVVSGVQSARRAPGKQHYLSPGVSLLQLGVRVLHLLQGIGPGDRHGQLAGRAQVAHDLRIQGGGRPDLGQERGSGKRRHPGHVEKVLEQEGDSAERSAGRRGLKSRGEGRLVQEHSHRRAPLRGGEVRRRPSPNLACGGSGRHLLPFAKCHGWKSFGQLAANRKQRLRFAAPGRRQLFWTCLIVP